MGRVPNLNPGKTVIPARVICNRLVPPDRAHSTSKVIRTPAALRAISAATARSRLSSEANSETRIPGRSFARSVIVWMRDEFATSKNRTDLPAARPIVSSVSYRSKSAG
ncbi:hypothetical protein AYO44_14245 [Planctomycetaceae bacterium SCGC AG-212-F19]|nr:hypothetical protein AYO44_14245 [Planctomycetaceae bacterium SCGC AG-212-F19]